MIYVNDTTISEEEFLSLLESTKNLLTSTIPNTTRMADGIEFEDKVFETMKECSSGTRFENHVERATKHGFPDILAAKFYGIEVKMTAGDKWTTTGNSVLETTREETVKRIYMFFGKFGNSFEVKYRLYQECLSDVGVTHSPRYKIDMNLEEGRSIFDKIGIKYDLFREEEYPIKRLKKYYSSLLKEGEELWWIDTNNENSDSVSPPIIKPLRKMGNKFKENFFLECLILFPEILSKSSLKFERPAVYLITQYNVSSSNLRDMFTAGGKKTILMPDGDKITVSQLIAKISKNKEKILETLNNLPEEILKTYWKTETIDANRLLQWKNLLKLNKTQETEFALRLLP